MVTTSRRWLRRPADPYDGPQKLTASRRWLRRTADAYDEPQKLTTARRWLRRLADAYDGSQMVTTARRKLTAGRREVPPSSQGAGMGSGPDAFQLAIWACAYLTRGALPWA